MNVMGVVNVRNRRGLYINGRRLLIGRDIVGVAKYIATCFCRWKLRVEIEFIFK